MTPWLFEHAADVISKYQLGMDGKTSYERAEGNKFSNDMCEIGEEIWYRIGKLYKACKLEPLWCEGVLLGMRLEGWSCSYWYNRRRCSRPWCQACPIGGAVRLARWLAMSSVPDRPRLGTDGGIAHAPHKGRGCARRPHASGCEPQE